MPQQDIKHFYIPDDQSIYLLSHKDAKKLKDWVNLCVSQLEKLGYIDIEMIGKGAFGFAFAGTAKNGDQLVFKFSRVTLPQHIQDRLEEEAFMQALVKHPHVPDLLEFQRIKKQSVLVMERAKGIDFEKYSLQYGPLPARLVIKVAVQLCEILAFLRAFVFDGHLKPIVHGDIKPSNLVWCAETEEVSLIDWGSCVFAQIDTRGQPITTNVMDLMSSDLQSTNARLGDVYFIGDDQLNGKLSSPRFDEQGLASTIYALASGQSSRYGRKAIPPSSLALPQEFATVLEALMSDEPARREEAGDYLLKNYTHYKRLVFCDENLSESRSKELCLLPTWIYKERRDIETVVYSSRKSYLRQLDIGNVAELNYIDDAQFDRYYKNYLQGMGETEKGFIAAVSRLGKYPVVGGLAIRWEDEGIYVDSSLNLFDPSRQYSFDRSVDNVIHLARAMKRKGVFKSCMFNAKNTLHVERQNDNMPFKPSSALGIPYEKSKISLSEDQSRMHSYFEDGDDPDELLKLPNSLMSILTKLNDIHHTGCIIFEALPKHLKIHNYYTLLDHSKQAEFEDLLNGIIELIPEINGLGISGFMKLPYKDTRFFEHKAALEQRFYPRNPKQKICDG
ncbi:protein kinase [Glaciecola sp. MH2013]|uniref:serine/threonine protein kinase n=1 Tax=Glaciecola sp. MH2013 TaxID=2785524 RepID=UPI00189F2DDE|nr:protein kinase [Glaciecola sp. MH2013]MBF7072780.1 protein kinase [Glaciecola sp. MH2013]